MDTPALPDCAPPLGVWRGVAMWWGQRDGGALIVIPTYVVQDAVSHDMMSVGK